MAQKIGYALAPNRSGKNVIVPFRDWGWELNVGSDRFYLRIYRRGRKWTYDVCYKSRDDADLQVEIQQEQVTTINGLPNRVVLTVSVDGGADQDFTLEPGNRVSLQALRGKEPTVSYLLEESGYYLTKYVYLLGPVAAGKSCLMCAAQTPTLTRRLRMLMNMGTEIKGGGAVLRTREVQERLAPNNIGAVHPFAFEIPGKNNQVNGIVYFVDLSGEIGIARQIRDRGEGSMKMENEGYDADDARLRNHVINLISRTADGLIVVYDKRALFRREDIGGQTTHGDPETVIQELRRMHKLPRRTSYVVTGADEIQSLLRQGIQPVEGVVLTAESPVFRPIGQEIDPDEQMYRHIAVAKDALGMVVNAPEDSACFLVSSLKVIQREGIYREHETLFDFSQSVNVELPLYWMIQSLVRLDD